MATKKQTVTSTVPCQKAGRPRQPSIIDILPKTLAPYLRGQPPTSKLPRRRTKTSSFRCSPTLKSRLRSNKPNNIVIGSKRLSITRMSFVNIRHWGSSSNNSRTKSLPSRTPWHRHSRKASLEPENLLTSRPSTSWSKNESRRLSCSSTTDQHFLLSESLVPPLQRNPGVRVPEEVLDSNLWLLL